MAAPPNYTLKLCSWLGNVRQEIPIGPEAYISWVQSVNNPGYFTFEVPIYIRQLGLDFMLQFYRSPGWESAQFLHFLGFLRYWRWERRDDGKIWTVMKGHDPNGLLDRRIVAYPGDNGWSYCDEPPDDEMIEIFERNFTSTATDPYRDLTKIRGLSNPVGANIAASPRHRTWVMDNVYLAHQYSNVAEVMRKLADIQYNNDTTADKSKSLFYGIKVKGFESGSMRKPVLRFEVNYGQWGQDRTSSGIVFSNANGSLINEFLEEDHQNEINVMYARGKGIKSLAYVAECNDDQRAYQSGWARREGFINASSQDTDSQVGDLGWAELEKRKPVIRAGGRISNTEQARYGTQWSHGDKIRIEVFGQRYDGVIKDTSFSLSDGEEDIQAYVVHEST